ncbi:MAG: mechanosensitive ion channel family protein [Pseudomonadota bacterium]
MNTPNIDFSHLILALLKYIGIGKAEPDSLAYQATSIIALAALSLVVWVIFRLLVTIKLQKLIVHSKGNWDDHLSDVGFFRRLANLTPGIFIAYANPLLNSMDSFAFKFFYYLSALYVITVSYLAFQSLLSGIDRIYQDTRFAKKAPITGFIQVGRLITTLIVVFLVLSLLLGQSPIYLLSGLTAIAAVLLLIFRDTILGFVSGIQIAANRMFNTGDWIEMPKYDINGEILEIGLTIVKVQNWDKTISTIPTFALTTEAVKNWRGMQLNKGRRIKRTLQIDVSSIAIATDEDMQSWSKLNLLTDYIKEKSDPLDENQRDSEHHNNDMVNGHYLTNVGIFRAYIENYLKSHPDIRQDLICMVRHLTPNEVGLPIEVYCFAADTNWVNYERIQSDIFDHLFAILPMFRLRAYQRITNEKR